MVDLSGVLNVSLLLLLSIVYNILIVLAAVLGNK